MINPAHPLPPNDPTASVLPQTSLTYPGTGGSYAVHNNVANAFSISNNMGGVPISNGMIPPTNVIEHTIQGTLVSVSKIIDHFIMEQIDDDDIKKTMVTQLVEEIIRNKCVEFTKQIGHSKNETIIRARIFVTPDTNVRIIREAKIVK